jgi:hypothetical protein
MRTPKENLVNTTIETYFQDPPSSCMSCHQSIANALGRDFVGMLAVFAEGLCPLTEAAFAMRRPAAARRLTARRFRIILNCAERFAGTSQRRLAR